MAEGCNHVYPQALLFGARTVGVPGRGTVLCASVGLPFRLADGEPIKPSDYYAAIATHVGPNAIPDAISPMPGAELLLLGPIPRTEAPRRVRIRCGEIVCRLRLEPDPNALPNTPFVAGPEDAVWHREENPVGRGADDERGKPLIVREGNHNQPVWLGATPFEHPARIRLAGVSQRLGSDGWPTDADPLVMFDAHKAFRTRSLHAGDPLEIEGLMEGDITLELPPYRAVMATCRAPAGNWVAETVRIHTVVVVPAAGIGAVFWRTAVALGDDILAENVIAVVAALEDIDAPPKDEQDLGIIAAGRWLDPVRSLDDRPLLPRALAPLGAPYQSPDAGAVDERQAAAEEWVGKEFGSDIANPFPPPEEAEQVGDALDKALDGDEDVRPPSVDELDEIGRGAIAASKKRHEEAGFPEPTEEEQRPPEERGDALDAEARARLRKPYQSQRELAIARAGREAPPEARIDADQALHGLNDARLIAPEPVLFWPAFTEAEAEQFGEAVFKSLATADPGRHIDVSGAIIGSAAGESATGTVGDMRLIAGRTFDGLLAEETVWRNVEFADCTFQDTTFAKGRFENCLFRDCTMERVNLSKNTLTNVTFRHCAIREQTSHGTNAVSLHYDDCTLESVTFVDFAIRDTVVDGGSWKHVEINDALLVRVFMRGTKMEEVTYSMVHGPECRFERLRMFKVWVIGMGFAGSLFEQVEAETCGFLGNAHFQMTRFERTRFKQTGFGNAKFHDAEFGTDCVFDQCDLGGAQFERTRLSGVRFLGCTMTMTVWTEADASGAWFMDSILRNVDFANANLMNAVFAGADLQGAKIDERLTAGADFRGTVLAE